MVALYSSQLVMVVAACLLLLGVPVHRGTFAKTKPLSSKSYEDKVLKVLQAERQSSRRSLVQLSLA